jgi:hypothetical protein
MVYMLFGMKIVHYPICNSMNLYLHSLECFALLYAAHKIAHKLLLTEATERLIVGSPDLRLIGL